MWPAREAIVEAHRGEDNNITFTIDADENPILIGRNGKTLDAIQTLLKNIFTDSDNICFSELINQIFIACMNCAENITPDKCF